MANKVYLYQDIYLYPGTYDRYTNLSKLYGRSGIYFEAKGEYSSDIGGYEYITKGPYNYTDTMYVPSSYTEMDTTYWVDMELDPSMDFSSCTLSGYDKNGNYMAYYFYEGTKVSIYCLEEDPSEEPPDLEQLSLVGSYYLSAEETYLYGPTHNDMEEGATYYITFTAEGGVENSFYLKPFVYHEMEGEDYYPGVYPIRFDFGDGYIRCEVSSDYGLVELYKLESTDPEDPETPSASVTASITLNATTGIATWSYSASSSDISFYEPYVQLWDLNDQIMDPIQIADSSYDFSEYMTSGQTYYATLRVGYYDYNNGTSDEVTARSQEVIYSPSSPDPDPEPDEPSGGTSFKARMTAIADAIRNKCRVSGLMDIIGMIDTLNAFKSKNGETNNEKYDPSSFDSCMTKLANVIRTKKGDTYYPFKISSMPELIASIEADTTNPLGMNIEIYEENGEPYIIVTHNAVSGSANPTLNVEWYINGSFSHSSSVGASGEYIYVYFGSTISEASVFAKVTLSAYVEGQQWSLTQESEHLAIGGGSGSEWEASALWYQHGTWTTYNPAEGEQWYAGQCNKCGASIFSLSGGGTISCGNTKLSGEVCGENVYIGGDEATYYCHVEGEYIGDYCDYSGPSSQGCMYHSFSNWQPNPPV